jgi:hypothetical protein
LNKGKKDILFFGLIGERNMSDERLTRNEIFGQTPQPAPAGMASPGYNDVPVETIPLPSRGLTYAAGSVLQGAASLDVRAMCTGEEDMLASKALQKKGTAVRLVIQNCFVPEQGKPPARVTDLLMGDRDTLLVAIRSLSYGPEYKAETTCPICEHKEQKTFILNKLDLKTLDIQPVQENTNLFAYTLPISKRNVMFKFLTVQDEEEIMKTVENLRKSTNRVSDNNVTMNLTASLVAVDGDSDKMKISTVVRHMLAGDSVALRRYISRNTPGIDMTQTMSC